MSNQSLLNELLRNVVDELDLDTAFRRVRYDIAFDFIQLPVELAIFEINLDTQIQYLKDTIKQHKYIVKSLRKIWVPKKNFLLRPGALPHLDDRVIFQALVDKIAPVLETELSPITEKVVFSSRLNPDLQSESMLLHPLDLWQSFNERAVELCDQSAFVLVSDIASYFESIDLLQLHETLASSGANPMYVEAIHYMLLLWAEGRTQGIPQMLAPCSFLANVYLSQVDKVMDRLGYKYIRYIDDIRIFVSSEVDGRLALLHLSEQLKRCYLDAQSSKTKLQRSMELKDHMTALVRHLYEAGIKTDENLTYFGNSKPRENIPEEKLLAFLEKTIRDPEYDDRHLRFCINHLGHIGSSGALNKVLDELYNLPQESATFSQYILQLSPIKSDKQTVERILEFLESKNCIYDWQMMWLLIVLIKYGITNMPYLKRLSRIQKLQQHFVCKAWLSYLLCSGGDLSFKREYISRYDQETSQEVKMAILCGVHSLDPRERDHFYSITQGKDRQIDQLIDILLNSRIETIYYPYFRKNIDGEMSTTNRKITFSRILKGIAFTSSQQNEILKEQYMMLTQEIRQHQRNLSQLRLKKAVYAKGEEPLSLLNQIEAEEQEILAIEEKMSKIANNKAFDLNS